MLKRFIHLACQRRWLKVIDKELDKYIKLKAELDVQWHMVNLMMDKFNERFGVDLRKGC